MNTYEIAGLKVNMSPFGKTLSQAEKYLTEYTEKADIEIEVDDEFLREYIKSNPELDRETAYYIVSGFMFYKQLLDYDGFMLHSSAISVDGNAYLFSGQCGIGKSTHTGYWHELLGERCKAINDDKPAIRIIDNTVYACGTPWSGKHDISENVLVPLKGICFISRGEQNEITRLPKSVSALRIIHQCTGNFSNEQWEQLLKMIDTVVDNVPVYLLKCVKDISAAQLSYKTMTGEKL